MTWVEGPNYNLIMLKLLIFIAFVVMTSRAFAEQYPSGQYFVSAYFRDSYYWQDGTLVKATKIDAHCRTYNFSSPLKLKFEDQMPLGSPYGLIFLRSGSPMKNVMLKKH